MCRLNREEIYYFLLSARRTTGERKYSDHIWNAQSSSLCKKKELTRRKSLTKRKIGRWKLERKTPGEKRLNNRKL